MEYEIMKVMILGGDGFCGWPTALRFAAKGHEVIIVDNLSRRKIDCDLSTVSATPIATIGDRINAARRHIGSIVFKNIDLSTNIDAFRSVIAEVNPDTIVHFAEQRAAPYSMISDNERRYTVNNNITATHNLCSAIIDLCPTAHLIHLGTMGVYGYTEAFGEIPEGYLSVKITETSEQSEILYPANPGSIYHMTKCIDQLIFQFYNKNWSLKVTDLHQGIVWGTETAETKTDELLQNRFDYDGIYGTVLNRFIVQAASGNNLSVYGSGGQSRAFININDTAECVYLAAINSDFNPTRVRIFNQVAEVRSVFELATMVSRLMSAKISHIDNPRKELPENKLVVRNIGLRSLGFDPILLEDKLLDEVKLIVSRQLHRIKKENFYNSPNW